MGRLKSAIRVLLGQRVTPLQIEKEWLEYKMIFEDLLQRWSASLARDAKAEKARIDRLNESRAPAQAPPQGTKAELRARFAAMRGIGGPSQTSLDIDGSEN